jgi:hypothetical protein
MTTAGRHSTWGNVTEARLVSRSTPVTTGTRTSCASPSTERSACDRRSPIPERSGGGGLE